MTKLIKVILISLLLVGILNLSGSTFAEGSQAKEEMHLKDSFTVGDSIYNNGFNLTLLSVKQNGNKINVEVEVTNIANEHKFINNNFFTVTSKSGEIIENNTEESVVQVSKGKKVSLSLTFNSKDIMQVRYRDLNSDKVPVWDL